MWEVILYSVFTLAFVFVGIPIAWSLAFSPTGNEKRRPRPRREED